MSDQPQPIFIIIMSAEQVQGCIVGNKVGFAFMAAFQNQYIYSSSLIVVLIRKL